MEPTKASNIKRLTLHNHGYRSVSDTIEHQFDEWVKRNGHCIIVHITDTVYNDPNSGQYGRTVPSMNVYYTDPTDNLYENRPRQKDF